VTRRVLALAAALLGLLVMHGVGTHSAHAASAHTDHARGGSTLTAPHDPATATTAGSGHRSGHGSAHGSAHASQPVPATADGFASRVSDTAAPLSHEVSEVVLALCLAVLLAVVGVVLLGSPWSTRSRLLPTPRGERVGPGTAVPARPPDLHALSVLRC